MISTNKSESFEVKFGPSSSCGAIWLIFDFHPDGILRGIGYQSEKGVTEDQIRPLLELVCPLVHGRNRSEIVGMIEGAVQIMAALRN